MNKWLVVVLLALSVLTGAMGLKALSAKVMLADAGSSCPQIAAPVPR